MATLASTAAVAAAAVKAPGAAAAPARVGRRGWLKAFILLALLTLSCVVVALFGVMASIRLVQGRFP